MAEKLLRVNDETATPHNCKEQCSVVNVVVDWQSGLTEEAKQCPQLLRNASRSALIVSACVVGMPWGKSL